MSQWPDDIDTYDPTSCSVVKSLPAMQEVWFPSLGRERSPAGGSGNPLQYSCLDISMGDSRTDEPGRLQSMGSQSDTTE